MFEIGSKLFGDREYKLPMRKIQDHVFPRGVLRKAEVVSGYNVGRGTSFCMLL